MNQFDFLYNKEIKKNYKITEQKRLSKNREREMGDVFRNKLCRYDVISEIICGIVNFKIKWKEEFIVIL